MKQKLFNEINTELIQMDSSFDTNVENIAVSSQLMEELTEASQNVQEALGHV